MNLGHCNKFEIEFQKLSRHSSCSSDNAELVISCVVLQRMAKKCAKSYNAHAELLFCSLDLLFSAVAIAITIVVFLKYLMTFFSYVINQDKCRIYGCLPFDQKLQGEFPEISMGKWYGLFPVWKVIIVCLAFFNDFYIIIGLNHKYRLKQTEH